MASGNLELWSGLIGFLLPNVMAVVNQPPWPSWLKATLAFLACVASSAVTVAIQQDGLGGDDWRLWLGSGLTILIAAQASYHGFWKPTEIAPKIEGATILPAAVPAPQAGEGDGPPPGPA